MRRGRHGQHLHQLISTLAMPEMRMFTQDSQTQTLMARQVLFLTRLPPGGNHMRLICKGLSNFLSQHAQHGQQAISIKV